MIPVGDCRAAAPCPIGQATAEPVFRRQPFQYNAFRRELHYGENKGDGDGGITFRTVIVSLTQCERGRSNGCYGYGNADDKGDIWQSARMIFC